MKVGIIGYSRSGKTTLFNALTGAHAAVGAFGSRDANLAVIKVPDERVDQLTAIFEPKSLLKQALLPCPSAKDIINSSPISRTLMAS